MADSPAGKCDQCGLVIEEKAKGFKRRCLDARVKLFNNSSTLGNIIEDQFGVMLSPDRRRGRFVCDQCACTIKALGKKREAISLTIKEMEKKSNSTTYIGKKIHMHGQLQTPRKRPRLAVTNSPKTLNIKKSLSFGDKNVNDVPTSTCTSKYCSPTKKSRKVPLDDTIQQATVLLRKSYYKKAIRILVRKAGFKKAMIALVKTLIRREISALKSKPLKSFEGKKTFEEMKQFSWNVKLKDAKECLPITTTMITATLTSETTEKKMGLATNPQRSVIPYVGNIMSIITFLLRRKHSELQELNSMQMWLAGCKKEVFARFNHLGLCVGSKGTLATLDRIREGHDNTVKKWKSELTDRCVLLHDCDRGSSSESMSISPPRSPSSSSVTMTISPPMSPASNSMTVSPPMSPGASSVSSYNTVASLESEMKEVIEENCAFSVCFDNVNQHQTVRHQKSDRKNQQYNMVQAYAAKDRVDTLHLSDVYSTPEQIRQIPLQSFLPSEWDDVDLRSEMTVIVTRDLVTHLQVFKKLRSTCMWRIYNEHTLESSKKSTTVPLGVLNKDETKIPDMIQIMEDYHKYVPVKPDDKPLVLPLYADGLSCERGNDAQNGRINGNNPFSQLQGFTVVIQEWHKRCLLLQDVFDELYDGSSSREKGTLFHLKNFFNHRNVTNRVKESFNYDEEFLSFVCTGYIIVAAMYVMKIGNIDEIPADMPANEDDHMRYLNKISTAIMEMVFLPSHNLVEKMIGLEEEGEENPYENRKSFIKPKSRPKEREMQSSTTDSVYNYSCLVIWRGLNQRCRHDAIRENDGNRMLMHWKFDMLQFMEMHHPKYFLAGQRLLSIANGALTDRLKETVKWNRTVNINGGRGKNLAMDLQMEFLNNEYKESVKHAGGQLTPNTIARHSQMIGVGKDVNSVYELQVSELIRNLIQSTSPVDRTSDISEFTKLMCPHEVFIYKPGRHHRTFPNVDFFPNQYLTTKLQKQCNTRLQRLLKEFANKREVLIMEEV